MFSIAPSDVWHRFLFSRPHAIPLRWVSKNAKRAVVGVLIALSADIATAGHPNAGIYHAALQGDICGIAQSVSVGASLNRQYEFTKGRTPLMASVISGNWNAVNFLLRIGADPTIRNNDPRSAEYGWTATDYAVKYERTEVLKLLSTFKPIPDQRVDAHAP